jgi:ubiquinone/menaquinone biosynthesis C-methylase UbiE
MLFQTLISLAAIVGISSLQSHALSPKPTPAPHPQPKMQCSRRQMLQYTATLSLIGFPESAKSLSPQEASIAYDSYADNYDSLDGGSASTMFGIDEARSSLFGQAKGNVLEIGAGTGLNLEKYNPSQLLSLTLLDISEGMLLQAQKRISSLPGFSEVPIKFIRADATNELVQTFDKNSFDTVVDSFSLCTMGNEGAKKCLNQISQVVKSKQDGGKHIRDRD